MTTTVQTHIEPDSTELLPAEPGVATSTDEEYLASAPVPRALAHLCLPMIAATTTGTIYSVVNAAFLGQAHDDALLAAITFATPIPTLVMAVGGVFGVGGSTMITRLLGAGERGRAKHISSLVLWGSLLAGVLTSIITLLLLGPITRALGADATSFHPTAVYTGVLLAFAPVLMAAFALEQVVRAEGAATTAMKGMVYSTLLNVVLDVVLILGMHLGVFGAALSIGLSNIFTVAYFVFFLQRRSTVADLSPRLLQWDPAAFKEIFSVGSSELLQSGFLLVSSLVLNHQAVRFGVDVVAGFGVAARVTQVPEFIAMGIAMGAIPLLAYSYGAGNKERLSLALRRCIQATFIIVVPLVALAWLFRTQLIDVFGGAALQAVGVPILVAMLVAALVNGITGLVTVYFQATGKGGYAGTMSMAAGLLFLPLALIAPHYVGLAGLVWSMPIAEIITAGIGVVLLLISQRPSAPMPRRAVAA